MFPVFPACQTSVWNDQFPPPWLAPPRIPDAGRRSAPKTGHRIDLKEINGLRCRGRINAVLESLAVPRRESLGVRQLRPSGVGRRAATSDTQRVITVRAEVETMRRLWGEHQSELADRGPGRVCVFSFFNAEHLPLGLKGLQFGCWADGGCRRGCVLSRKASFPILMRRGRGQLVRSVSKAHRPAGAVALPSPGLWAAQQ